MHASARTALAGGGRGSEAAAGLELQVSGDQLRRELVGGEVQGARFRRPVPAALVAGATFAALASAVRHLPAAEPRGGLDQGAAIGASLFFRDYVVPFELLSVLLLAAVLGALLLARQDRPA